MSKTKSTLNRSRTNQARQYRSATVEAATPRNSNETSLGDLRKGDRLRVSGKNGAMFVLEVA